MKVNAVNMYSKEVIPQVETSKKPNNKYLSISNTVNNSFKTQHLTQTDVSFKGYVSTIFKAIKEERIAQLAKKEETKLAKIKSEIPETVSSSDVVESEIDYWDTAVGAGQNHRLRDPY